MSYASPIFATRAGRIEDASHGVDTPECVEKPVDKESRNMIRTAHFLRVPQQPAPPPADLLHIVVLCTHAFVELVENADGAASESIRLQKLCS